MLIFNDIKKDAKIAIYGSAGIKPLMLLDFIKQKRPDIKVVFFINSFKEGVFEGYNIVLPQKVKYEDADYVIITSFDYAQEMKQTIEATSKIKTLLLNDYFDYSSYDKVKEILETEEDKALYELVVSSRKNGSSAPIEHFIESTYKEIPSAKYEYLDFINKDALKTVISGGGYDGYTATVFLKEFKNLKRIYTFEPMYEQFKNAAFDKIIQDSKKASIHKLGLWKKKEQLFLELKDSGSRISQSELGSSSETSVINTISIDEFVEENKTGKIDFIKMDIEGAESLALNGAKKTITKDRPQMAICIYHSNTDYISIPLYLNSILKDYVFKIGHYEKCFYSTVFYAIPKELYKPSRLKVN